MSSIFHKLTQQIIMQKKNSPGGGCEEGTAVIADLQTSGRGRLGRKWSSKNKKGF